MNVWEFGYKGKNGFRRNMYGDAATIKNWVLKFGPQDIYTSVFKYESDDVASSKLEAGLYFDIDNEENLEAAYEDLLALVAILHSQRIERTLFHVWFSGFKGFHLTIPWNAMGIAPARDLPAVYKKIALELNQLLPNKNIDTSVYEERRLWRFPNTINSKSGLYKIQVADYIQPLEKIKELAKTSQPIAPLETASNKILTLWVDRARREIAEASRPKVAAKRLDASGISANTAQFLNQGKTKGGRDNYIYWLACRLWNERISKEEAISELQKTGELCSPPASANDSDFNSKSIERTVGSAYRNKGGAQV